MKTIFQLFGSMKLGARASGKWRGILLVYCLGVATALPLDAPGDRGAPYRDYRLETNGMLGAATFPFVFNGLPANW